MPTELTPFEEAILNAHDFGASLAATFIVADLVKKNDELRIEKGKTPICGHMEKRKALITEIRRNNQALSIVAQLQEMNLGISA